MSQTPHSVANSYTYVTKMTATSPAITLQSNQALLAIKIGAL